MARRENELRVRAGKGKRIEGGQLGRGEGTGVLVRDGRERTGWGGDGCW